MAKYCFGEPQQPEPLIVGPSGRLGPITIMIAGLARGGTSATAAAVDGLGIPVGISSDGHYETPGFKDNLGDDIIMKAVRKQIDEQNDMHDKWGVQVNAADIVRLSSEMRNPHLILVVRDSVALVQRHIGARDGYGDAWENLQLSIPFLQSQLWHIAVNCVCPTMLISFERLRIVPHVVIRQIAEFVHCEPSNECFEDACNRVNLHGGYIIQNRIGYQKP